MRAELEAAFLNTFQGRWQLAVDEFGFGFVQGKTMLLRRSELAHEGGLAALAREVAKDAAATKIARLWGREVHVADEPFPQPLGRRSFAGVWQRQLRWARLRRLSFPGFFCAEFPAGGVFPCLLVCWLATAGVLPWAGVAGMMLAWYGAEALLARAFGWPLRVRTPLFWIARDLLLPVLWAYAWAAKGYEWRGNPSTPAWRQEARRGPFRQRASASRGYTEPRRSRLGAGSGRVNHDTPGLHATQVFGPKRVGMDRRQLQLALAFCPGRAP